MRLCLGSNCVKQIRSWAICHSTTKKLLIRMQSRKKMLWDNFELLQINCFIFFAKFQKLPISFNSLVEIYFFYGLGASIRNRITQSGLNTCTFKSHIYVPSWVCCVLKTDIIYQVPRLMALISHLSNIFWLQNVGNQIW